MRSGERLLLGVMLTLLVWSFITTAFIMRTEAAKQYSTVITLGPSDPVTLLEARAR